MHWFALTVLGIIVGHGGGVTRWPGVDRQTFIECARMAGWVDART